MARLSYSIRRHSSDLPWFRLKFRLEDYGTSLESMYALRTPRSRSPVHLISRNPDLYHTAYNLAGYSTAQHRVYRSLVTEKKLLESWKPSKGPISGADDEIRRVTWARACAWQEDEGAHFYLGSEQNRVVSAIDTYVTALI